MGFGYKHFGIKRFVSHYKLIGVGVSSTDLVYLSKYMRISNGLTPQKIVAQFISTTQYHCDYNFSAIVAHTNW